MISLSGKFRYYLCTDNVTLRFRHRGLREYIKGKLHRDPCSGDVYIFLSRDLSRIRVYYFHHDGEILTEKILHAHRFTHPIFLDVYYFHHDGEILTEKILHAHRFTHPIFLDAGKHVYHISWSSFVYLLEGIIRKEKDEYFDEEEDDEIDAVELQESV